MFLKFATGILTACLWCLMALPLDALSNESPVSNDGPSNSELLRRIEILAAELEKQRVGKALFPTADEEGKYGMGPAASKVYKTEDGLSIGGYGEFIYQNFSSRKEDGSDSKKTDMIDALRAIIYAGYRFSDSIIFNSEIEIEHANEIYLEFAYIDFLWRDWCNVRVGMLLAPLGFINELHEPPLYLGARRPLTEQRIIPTTWRELGVGIFGSLGDFGYRLALLTSFDGKKFSAGGIRDGRQKGIQAKAEDFGIAFRLDYEGIDGLLAGFGTFFGDTGQENDFDAPLSMVDFHIEFRSGGLLLRGLLAMAWIGDVVAINTLAGYSETKSVGESMYGCYIEAGYDLLRPFGSGQQLHAFMRFEFLDSQWTVPDGYLKDPANRQQIITAGLSWKPILNVVIKADYQWVFNDAKSGIDQYNLAVGYMF